VRGDDPVTTAVDTKQEILERLGLHRERISALGVTRLGLFGSFLRDEQRPESDVDILVDFQDGKKTFDNFIRLAFLLEEIFQRHVELVTSQALSPYIGPRILAEVQDVDLGP
jgi:predicted nucleotidyltransferase